MSSPDFMIIIYKWALWCCASRLFLITFTMYRRIKYSIFRDGKILFTATATIVRISSSLFIRFNNFQPIVQTTTYWFFLDLIWIMNIMRFSFFTIFWIKVIFKQSIALNSVHICISVIRISIFYKFFHRTSRYPTLLSCLWSLFFATFMFLLQQLLIFVNCIKIWLHIVQSINPKGRLASLLDLIYSRSSRSSWSSCFRLIAL